uniref:hypothetical protein n=1 Tax=Citrobacter koseri TaxID=545 RepID=UPI001954323A
LFGLHSPFSQTDAPDHMVESRVQRIRHIKLTMILTLIMGVIGMFATPLVVFIIRDGHSPSPQTLRVILDYVALT